MSEAKRVKTLHVIIAILVIAGGAALAAFIGNEVSASLRRPAVPAAIEDPSEAGAVDSPEEAPARPVGQN